MADEASRADFIEQARAEIAFAKSMGWDDWTHDEESEAGMVRGYRVQWSPDVEHGLIVVRDDDDDDLRIVLVTGRAPTYEIHGWTTVADAKRNGFRIGRG